MVNGIVSMNFLLVKYTQNMGFGRALHGIQDFYAHSNWADDAQPPFSVENPPGLKRSDYPIFLDLRAENNISDQVPINLTTGCFGGVMTDGPVGKAGHPLEPGSMDCTGRITHGTLNKDNGIIDDVTGITRDPGPNTPRSDIPMNFERAVAGAIKDSKRLWRHFREEIRRSYGAERGNIIICAIVRDDPTTDCYGRRVAMLRDAPRGINRVAEMQIPVHRWLLEELEGMAHDEGPDEGVTKQNSTKCRGRSDQLQGHHEEECPPGHPDHLSEGLDIGSAVDALVGNGTTMQRNKTAVVALSANRVEHLSEHIAQVFRAGDEGIRVHLGLLPPGGAIHHTPSEGATELEKAQMEDLMTSVLRSGGTYSILHSRSSIPRFLDHVVSRGLTQYDNADDTATLLVPGLSICDYVTPEAEPRRYSFDASTIDNIIIAVAPITPNLALRVSVRHVRNNEAVRELDIGRGGNASFRTELSVTDIPRTDAWYELEVAHIAGDGHAGSGVFEVSVEAEATGPNSPKGHNEHIHDEL